VPNPNQQRLRQSRWDEREQMPTNAEGTVTTRRPRSQDRKFLLRIPEKRRVLETHLSFSQCRFGLTGCGRLACEQA
jgi:hypothetical protein